MKNIRKVCIASGEVMNAGKSVIAKHLRDYLSAEGVDARVVNVEKKDHLSAGEDLRIQPNVESIENLLTQLYLLDEDKALIVDCGGGAIFEQITRQMKGYSHAMEAEFDALIFPVTPATKSGTVAQTIGSFIDAGVAPEKITVIFNRVDSNSTEIDLVAQNSGIFEDAEKLGFNIAKTPIYDHPVVHDLLKGRDTVISKIVDRDLIGEMKQAMAAGDKATAAKLSAMNIFKSKATIPANNFKAVFNEIFQ